MRIIDRMSTFLHKGLRLVLLVCAVASISHSTVNSSPQSNTWQRFKAAGFSVLLPEPPTATEIARPAKLFEKSRTARLFSAYEDNVVYVILAFENPNHRDPLSRFVAELERYSVSGQAERLQQQLSGAGFTGQEYRFTSSPTLTGIIRFYLAADMVYIVEAIGDNVDKPSVKQFLDSFSIGSDKGTSLFANSPTTEPVHENPDITKLKDVATKVRVLVKPEPMYTETARQAAVTGTVVLRAVFTSTGHVTNLRAVTGLPHGLTERALEAARNIKFIPATKEGRPVSMYIQLEYNFNLY